MLCLETVAVASIGLFRRRGARIPSSSTRAPALEVALVHLGHVPIVVEDHHVLRVVRLRRAGEVEAPGDGGRARHAGIDDDHLVVRAQYLNPRRPGSCGR